MNIIRNPEYVHGTSFGAVPVRFDYTYSEASSNRRLKDAASEPDGGECCPASYDQWTADPRAKEMTGDSFGGEFSA